ncbi:30S ribosomal protein S9 [Candidatus Woesearchaeota archaeon]|nr:30S ribosomal protein S9 [Candidatus Woesearchaeota archaeon]
MSEQKIIHISGKRKRAIARVTVRAGNGSVRINSRMLDSYEPKLARMKISEPLILSGDLAGKINVDVAVQGGGQVSQAGAIRLGIGRALVAYSKDDQLKQTLLDYDRTLLVADVRRKETRKPNDSKARAKRQKSYR